MFDTANKENPFIKNILDNLSSVLVTLKTEIANIDETYRKKLEEAKKSLNACLEETQKQYDYWSGLVDMNISVTPKKRRSRKAAAETVELAPDEVVVDKEAEAETETIVENTEEVNDQLPFDAPVTQSATGFDVEEESVQESESAEESEAKTDDSDWGEEDPEKAEEDDWGSTFDKEW